MTYIGKAKRKVRRPMPEPIIPLIPVEPREEPITVPNWPAPVKVPAKDA